jgi:hypothetical protein
MTLETLGKVTEIPLFNQNGLKITRAQAGDYVHYRIYHHNEWKLSLSKVEARQIALVLGLGEALIH